MIRKSYAYRDGTLSALHFGDSSAPVRLVFLHANGFNALSYRSLLERIGVHAIAFDMRGHGQSRDMPQPSPLRGWQIFRDDCVEFFERHLPDQTDGPVVLAGHSFGAVSALLAAPALKDQISGFVGFDPVTMPLIFRLTSALPGGVAYMKKRVPIARSAGRRRAIFESPEAAFSHWQGRGAFRGMPDDVLRDYVTGGLFEDSGGQWRLACDPAWEQAIFTAQWHNLFRAARDLPDNSRIIYAGGKPPVSTRSTRAAVQTAQPGTSVTYDTELGHMFPLTHADRALSELQAVLGG